MDQVLVVIECRQPVYCTAQKTLYSLYSNILYLCCRDPPGSEQLPSVQRLQLSVQGLGQGEWPVGSVVTQGQI